MDVDRANPPLVPCPLWDDVVNAAHARGLDPLVLMEMLIRGGLDHLARAVVVTRGREGGEDGQQR